MNEIERYWLTSRKIMVFGEHISGLIFLKCCKVVSFFWTNFTNDVNIDFDDDLQISAVTITMAVSSSPGYCFFQYNVGTTHALISFSVLWL